MAIMKKSHIATSVLFVAVQGLFTTIHLGAIATPMPSEIQMAQAARKPLPPESTSAVKKPVGNLTFGLANGTPIKLRFKETISSKTAKTNDPITFEVAENVMIGNTVVIAKGANAKGIIVEARRSGMLGRKGKLEIMVREVELVSGERIAVRSSEEKGGGHAGGLLAAAAVVNPLFLLASGKNITYKAGTEFNAFVDGDYELDRAKFQSSIKK
jgi:hypothetical protein